MPVVKKGFRRGPGRAGVLPSVGDSGGVRGRALVGCRLSGLPEGCGVARWWVAVFETSVLDSHIDTRHSWRVPRQLSHILLTACRDKYTRPEDTDTRPQDTDLVRSTRTRVQKTRTLVRSTRTLSRRTWTLAHSTQTLVHKPAYLATTRGPDKPGCGAVADAVLAKK